MNQRYTAESVTEGHPDKVCDDEYPAALLAGYARHTGYHGNRMRGQTPLKSLKFQKDKAMPTCPPAGMARQSKRE